MTKKPEKIKVIIFEPFKRPYVKEIENNVDTFQSIVDGWIDFIRLDNNIDIICNDSFLFDKREYPNRSIFRYGHETFIYGTFFFIKTLYDDDGLDYHISLSDEEIEKILSDFISIDKKIITNIFDEKVLNTNYSDYSNDMICFESKNYFANISFIDDLLLLQKTDINCMIDKDILTKLKNLDSLKLPHNFDNNISYIEYVLFLINLKDNFFKVF